MRDSGSQNRELLCSCWDNLDHARDPLSGAFSIYPTFEIYLCHADIYKQFNACDITAVIRR
jgi:hypothetical protein